MNCSKMKQCDINSDFVVAISKILQTCKFLGAQICEQTQSFIGERQMNEPKVSSGKSKDLQVNVRFYWGRASILQKIAKFLGEIKSIAKERKAVFL